MSMVTVRMPEAMLAERHRLGLDRRDEVWDGVYHMVPPADYEHQRLAAELIALLLPVARREGLELRPEVGVIAPGVTDWTDYKVPDLVVADPQHRSERGVEGRAELVIEIRSPGDETLDKIDWYGRVGVQELVTIDRDTKAVRQWVLQGSTLVERRADVDGWLSCRAIPVRLRATSDGGLEVETGTDTIKI